MRRWVVAVLTAAAWVGMTVPWGTAQGVTFDTDPVVGDRRVELSWMPDEDDPVFTGNLDLYFIDKQAIAGGEAPFFAFTTEGPDIWFWEDAQRRFVHLVFEDSLWAPVDTTGPLPAEHTPTCFAVHPLGSMLLAGLADGSFAAWTPAESDDPVIHDQDKHEAACASVAFKPLASAQVFPFISVGDDGRWKSWTQPGVIDKQAVVLDPQVTPPDTLALVALGLSRSGNQITVADESGTVFLYNLVGAAQIPRAVIRAHEGERVTSIVYSENGGRIATADASGQVGIWGSSNGAPLGGDVVETTGPLAIRFSRRESPFLAYVTPGGDYGVLDGFNGREYVVRTHLEADSVRHMAIIPTGGSVYFTDREGNLEWWNLGRCVPTQERPNCFGGYRLLRGLYPEDIGAPEELVLLRVYDFSDSTWGWMPNDTLRVFVDPDSIIAAGGDSSRIVAGPHNGTPYYYSLQKFYWTFLDGGRFIEPRNSPYEGFFRAEGESEPTPLIPRPDAVTSLPLLGDVYVVPNPYVEGEDASQFGPLSEPMVRFFNLPAEATIRIFTSSGDLVDVVHHVRTAGNFSGGSVPWDLKNEYGRDVISGVYLYAVETPGGETATGFFTVVR